MNEAIRKPFHVKIILKNTQYSLIISYLHKSQESNTKTNFFHSNPSIKTITPYVSMFSFNVVGKTLKLYFKEKTMKKKAPYLYDDKYKRNW